MNNLFKLLFILFPAGIIFNACEGPAGPSGTSADESCMVCHNREVVDQKKAEYEHSLHFLGEAYEEGSRTACAPCHSQQGFLYAVENNIPANDYMTDAKTASLPGRLDCMTCHNKIHTTYTIDDFALTTTEAVPMVMWAGSKTIDLKNESSNLCVKCHQPRQVSGTAGVINYAALVSSPTTPYNLSAIGYRTGVHYGTQGAMHAGDGGIEFGTGYDREHPHNQAASCATCHMPEPLAMSGGHSFEVNFNGCNTSGCHTSMSQQTLDGFNAGFDELMATLITEINTIGGGHDILQRDPVDNEYHGYIDIFDRTANPTAYWGATGNPAFPTLTNEQFGAIINFQLLIRDGSSGIHNPGYMMQLLENTLDAL